MTVYFIRKTGDREGPVKIGYTRDLANRIRGLNTATPGGVEVLATVVSGGRTLEAHLHQRFSHLQISGEWFGWDDDLHHLMRMIGRHGDAALDAYLLGDDEAAPVYASPSIAKCATRLNFCVSHYMTGGLTREQAIVATGIDALMIDNAVKHVISGRTRTIAADRFASIEAAYVATLLRQQGEINKRLSEVSAARVEADELCILDEVQALAEKVRLAKERIGA